MKSTKKLALLVALTSVAPLSLSVLVSPAEATVVNTDPSQFITTLSTDAFQTLRTGDHAAARSKFRTLLAQHFAVDQIGDRLIRRWLPTITPAQKAAYKEAFPNFIIGTYADRLFDYSNATLKVIRTAPVGSAVDVTSQVTKPGTQPVLAIWSVLQTPSGYKVTNLKVGGINLAISQAADFDAIIQRKGFDGLVQMMKSRS
jgi:phospholipid transport system substrate-binding protein